MSKNVIELQGVTKVYKLGAIEVPALHGISLKIQHGEFVGIMGPSGSGKSTLMNMIGSLDWPTEGKIFLDGQDITRISESNLAQLRGRKIGFIFQQFNLLSSLSALENVGLPLVFQGVPQEKRNERAEKVLEMMGLGDRMGHKPNELSGGQQQRVAIARALVVEPEVILADEPTGNLDSKTGEDVMRTLKKLNGEGKTIVLITHEKDIAAHARRKVFLKDGLVLKDSKGG
ncbi:MAG TPA: ABC transporter ATP-binding protein [Candidatus Norongarragalinales archaeon]|nr:ABC transporter ATP-binding protein [Candidatus Norongarragalinales archaeon]